MRALADPGPERMHPAIALADPAAAHWVAQAVLRLRRELAWVRHLATGDAAQAALDLLRHERARAGFLATDPAGAWLGACLAALPPPGEDSAFARLAREMNLGAGERFALGLALAARLDAALGPVFAAVQEDAARPWPTLGLAQRLWDEPLAVLAAADATRPLLSLGFLAAPEGDLAPSAPLEAASWLARWVAGAGPSDFGLAPLPPAPADPERTTLARRLAARPLRLEVIPLVGTADAGATVASLASASGRTCLAGEGQAAVRLRVAWLAGADLLLASPLTDTDEVAALAAILRRAASIPLRVFLRLYTADLIAAVRGLDIGPVVPLAPTDPATRAALIAAGIGTRARRMEGEIATTARDYRLEPEAIARLTAGLAARGGSLPKGAVRAAARAECHVDFHGLAEPVAPRFGLDDIVLPPAIRQHLLEVIDAVAHVGRVHYDWGGAEALSEGGVAVLFAGVPGTGKTMAAEVLAKTLDLPLYRIDLSQVVNKYIGETEKNLRRVFDAAERMRSILFFDEADALFGKRTEVRDANDRFANIETGYLLQRMERFSGVAILATNRRRDLDEAFARRLRHVIEFPVPGPEERAGIWTRVFPPKVDLSALDVPFLARQFQLTGGHIRSVAFNASLSAAARGPEPVVTMRDVLVATKRELDKLNRTSGPDLFGPWHARIEELRT